MLISCLTDFTCSRRETEGSYHTVLEISILSVVWAAYARYPPIWFECRRHHSAESLRDISNFVCWHSSFYRQPPLS